MANADESLERLITEDLRKRAHRLMKRERVGHTLQTTALVNEAWIRLQEQLGDAAGSRTDFLNKAVAVMRHILVSHARARNAAKRGGGWERKPLDNAVDWFESEFDVDLLDLDEALERLQQAYPRQSRVATLRMFGGRQYIEIGELLGISASTVETDWQIARAQLRQWLN